MGTQLSDRQIKALKASDKAYRVQDAHQLYVVVSVTGIKAFRLDYKLPAEGSKRKTLTLGKYPEVTLKEARKLADDARVLIRQNVDPIQDRRAALAKSDDSAPALTLREVAESWIELETQWSERHRKTLKQRLEYDILRFLGDRPITEITAPIIEARLEACQARGVIETAHRLATIIKQLYKTKRVAALIPDNRIMRDIAEDLQRLPPKRKRGKYPAQTDPRKFSSILRKIENFDGSATVKAALRLSPLLILRPTELRTLEWADINLVDSMIIVQARHMKSRDELLLPLSTQAVRILTELHAITGAGGLVFPSPHSRFDVPASAQKPFSNNTINKALRSVGVPQEEQCAHGFRASCRTIAVERLGIPKDVIELQLDHILPDSNHGAYGRETLIDQRKAMMQRWADFCDELRADRQGNTVIPFRSAAS